MIFGFLVSLCGCSQTKDHGAWTCLIVSNISPDRRESYSFRVNVSDGGEMVLYGYCYDEENEYRSDEGFTLSFETVYRLRQMEIEKLPQKTPKRKFRIGEVVDTVERIAQITYEDGAELGIILSNEQRAEIVSILGGELMASLSAEKHGEWSKLFYSRSGGDDFSNYFSFGIEQNSDGELILSGYCHDDSGEKYENEDGLAISFENARALRDMKLEMLAPYRVPEFDDVEEPVLLDGVTTTLTLYFEDGASEEKIFSRDVEGALFELLRKELTE